MSFCFWHASAHFAQSCLEPYKDNLRAISALSIQAYIMHWHEFGDLEGPGGSHAGGWHLLFLWGKYCEDQPDPEGHPPVVSRIKMGLLILKTDLSGLIMNLPNRNIAGTILILVPGCVPARWLK
jgi:hypothetical protein